MFERFHDDKYDKYNKCDKCDKCYKCDKCDKCDKCFKCFKYKYDWSLYYFNALLQKIDIDLFRCMLHSKNRDRIEINFKSKKKQKKSSRKQVDIDLIRFMLHSKKSWSNRKQKKSNRIDLSSIRIDLFISKMSS